MPKLTIENILKIGLPYLIILGVTNLASYYGTFHIPILEYLEFSEIITVFLSHIYIIFFLFIILSYYFISNHKLISYFAVIAFCIFVFINFLGDPLFQYNYSYLFLLSFYVFCLASITIFRISGINKKISLLNEDQKKSFGWVMAIIFFGISLILFSGVGNNNADAVIKKHVFKNTLISIDGKEFISNDTCYYVGKTNRYIFLYDEKNNAPIIYPIEKVDRIILHKKKVSLSK